MRVLILGGTAEARELAAALTARRVHVVSSLAGRVSRPRLPDGAVRIGGFGGVHGLVEFLRTESISHLVDATHPFARTMTEHGAAAADRTGVPFVRLSRPGWSTRPDSTSWHWVSSYEQARVTAEQLGERPFLTTGRQTLTHFVDAWRDRAALVRMVEPPADPLPAPWTVVLDRGPYDVAGELKLIRENRVDVLLSKDSGGSYTTAKLDAAATLGIPVVIVARPELPTGVRERADVWGILSDLSVS